MEEDLFAKTEHRPRPRSPDGINVHRFLEAYGIKVIPYAQCSGNRALQPNTIRGGRTVARLMRKDMDRTALVIRCIQVSGPDCFTEGMLWAVWQVIGAHLAHRAAPDVINVFRGINLPEIRERAKRACKGQGGYVFRASPAMAVLLADLILTKEAAK